MIANTNYERVTHSLWVFVSAMQNNSTKRRQWAVKLRTLNLLLKFDKWASGLDKSNVWLLSTHKKSDTQPKNWTCGLEWGGMPSKTAKATTKNNSNSRQRKIYRQLPKDPAAEHLCCYCCCCCCCCCYCIAAAVAKLPLPLLSSVLLLPRQPVVTNHPS